jgi:hypothetical protein
MQWSPRVAKRIEALPAAFLLAHIGALSVSHPWRTALIGVACLLVGSSGCGEQQPAGVYQGSSNQPAQSPFVSRQPDLQPDDPGLPQVLDVFVDGSEQPILNGVYRAGWAKIGGEKFLAFLVTPPRREMTTEEHQKSIRYVNPSKIVCMKASQAKKGEDGTPAHR